MPDLNERIDGQTLRAFVEESNMIEGLTHKVKDDELRAHRLVLSRPIETETLERFVYIVAPGHQLRRMDHMNVRIGQHIAPEGGPQIEKDLNHILSTIHGPFDLHREYLTLHPFSDGNGRSARVIWLHQMLSMGLIEQIRARGFLHNWYYQTLQAHDKRR